MWIGIGIGAFVLVLAVGVAVVPLVTGSVRVHRWHHRRMDAGGRPSRAIRRRVDCPFCAATFDGHEGEAVADANRHLLRRHAGKEGAELADARRR